MRIHPVLALLPLVLAACGADSALAPPYGSLPHVTFSAADVPGDSSATGVGCTRAQNYDYQYHFTVDTLRFHDPLPGLDTLCGDLAFTGRVRHDTVWYTGVQDSTGGESPWVYWWRRSRDLQSGATAALDTIARHSVAPGDSDSVAIDMPLGQQYDGLGVVAVYLGRRRRTRRSLEIRG
jgi:hypothetical protein